MSEGIEDEIVLWQGGAGQFLAKAQPTDSLIAQSRFFITGDILVSRYGVVMMLVVDNKPARRNVSYIDPEWMGVSLPDNVQHTECLDPVARAHFVGTENGFSLIRALVLPSHVAEIFASDQFLGEPMIAKCFCEKGIFGEGVEFDEDPAAASFPPVSEARSLIQQVASESWKASSIQDPAMEQWRQTRAGISFHAWFAFDSTIARAQTSLVRSIGNFDRFLSQFPKRPKPYVSGGDLALPVKA